jgi:hypothetical protein
MYKRLAIAFSVANLCFFKAWRELLSSQTFAYLYFWKHYPGYTSIISLVINVFLLTLIFYAGYNLILRVRGPILQNLVRVTFLVILLRALNGVRVQFESLNTQSLRAIFGRTGFFALGMALFVLLIFVTVRYGLDRVTRSAAIVALVLTPFGVIGMAQGTWLAIKYAREWHDRPSASVLPANVNKTPRVLWLIFDEMSESVAFAARPASVTLPNFDRLRTEALFATNGFPPAGHTTQSIPALLTGRLVASVQPAGPNELMLTFPSQSPAVGWSTQPDIFSEARAAGLNTAVVGWYHPYCRVVGARLTSCHWQPVSVSDPPNQLGIIEKMLRQDIDLVTLLPFSGTLRDHLLERSAQDYRVPQLAVYQTLLVDAERAAIDPDLGLTFVHLPIPHPPYIYDRQKGAWDTSEDAEYLDNLALADRALGELRQTMERAGTWDDTTILISSDHWWRTDYWRPVKSDSFWSNADSLSQGDLVDHRIPFLVKLAGQRTALTYDAPFNTILTHDLILDIVNRKVSRADQLITWLNTHKTIGESPYQSYDDPK